MKLIKKDNKKGFTLIELVVVIAILAVLALILIPSITGYVNKANTAKHEANARAIYTSATLAKAEKAEGGTVTSADVTGFTDVYFGVYEIDDKIYVGIYKEATSIPTTATTVEAVKTGSLAIYPSK